MDEQKRQLLRLLEEQPGLRRKQLIERCIGQLGYSEEQLRDRGADSAVVREKSRLGAALTALIENGDVEENEAGRLTVQSDAGALLEQEQAEALVLRLLQDGKVWQKHRIFSAADQMLAEQGLTAGEVHSAVGQALARLVREKRVRETPQGFRLPPASAYPDTELGGWLLEARNGGDLCKCFLGAVHVRGGEWLESYAVRLLTNYYRRCGKTVTEASVTGGSDDGGLDGVIETTDWLGFRERTLMQMKNRYSQVCAKDVREFYGAVCAEQGSRGVFITVSTFHPEAQRLLDKIDNLIGIDGKKLFEIASRCGFGVLKENGRLRLDDDLFLDTE